MGERFPVAPRSTEPSFPTLLRPALNVNRRQRGVDPAAPTDEVRMSGRAVASELPFPLLLLQVEMASDRESRKELGGRNLLGGHADVRGALALGDPHGVVDDGRRINLHGDRIRIGCVEAVEIEHL